MRLYKYVVPERIDILQNASIRFSQAAALNDPFELKPYFEAFAEDGFIRQIFLTNAEVLEGFEIGASMVSQVIDELEKQFPGDTHKEKFAEIRRDLPPVEVLKQQAREEYPETVESIIGLMKNNMPYLRNEVIAKYSENIGILSLTEKRDNLLMWAHYANNYKGFVIEFDKTRQFFNSRRFPADSCGGLRKVKYSDVRPSRRLLMEMTPEEFFLIKSKQWEYEQEWRMIASLEDAKDLNLTKQGKQLIDADGLPVFLCPIPPACITGIVFGSRMTEENKTKVSDLLSNDSRYSQVKKYQSVLDEKTFKLHTIRSHD